MFRAIPESETWTEIDPVQEGFSGDEKFHVCGPGGECLLRLSPAEKKERRLREFEALRALEPLRLNLPRALAFGSCEGGVYTLLSWVEGRPAAELLPGLSLEQQRAVGRQAGGILRALHSVPAPLAPDWAERYGGKLARRAAAYRACPVHTMEHDEFAAFALGNAALLSGRPSCFQHGDYSVANMVLDAELHLGVIDFDRMDYGDPWEEFSRLPWSVDCSPAFSRALLRAYFGGEPPRAFWPLLALYLAVNQISSLPWALAQDEEQVEILKAQGRQVRAWYAGPYGLSRPVWYVQDEAEENSRIKR